QRRIDRRPSELDVPSGRDLEPRGYVDRSRVGERARSPEDDRRHEPRPPRPLPPHADRGAMHVPACQISSWEKYDRKPAGRLTASQKVDREPAYGGAPRRRVDCSGVAPVRPISLDAHAAAKDNHRPRVARRTNYG